MHAQPRERGSITVFFCFFVLVIVGAISYSLYVGQQVERRIHLQNTSDAAVVATTNHAATGLNMIAANNLAIGASIHISGSVVILASYLSVVRALTYGFDDVVQDIVAFIKGNVSMIQKDVWNKLAIVPGIYMRTAAGLTVFNAFLRDYWLYPAPLRAIETTRLNAPGALDLPLQKRPSLFPAIAKYDGIKQSDPRDTVCHAIRSSEAVDGVKRDSFVRWMQGPLMTLGDNGVVQAINFVLDKLALIQETVTRVSGIKLGFVNCGYGLKVKLFDSMNNLAGFMTGGALGTTMTGVIGTPTVQAALSEVHQDVGLFCKALYEPQYLIMRGVALAKVATFDHDYAQRIAMAKMLKGFDDEEDFGDKKKWKKSDNMTCTARNADGKEVGPVVKGALPMKDASGATKCVKTTDIKWYCPLKPELKLYVSVCGNHNEELEKNCAKYEEFKHSEPGIEIADWGNQAKTYADSSEGGIASATRQKTLGFLYPDPQALDKFRDSLTFINAVTNPLRTANEIRPGTACPEGMKTKVEGKDFCESMPMIGFTNMFERASRDAMRGQVREDVNLMGGGIDALVTKPGQDAAHRIGRLDGSMTGTFARAQWVVSQSDAYFLAGAKDPSPAETPMQLFWPAWKTRLRPVTLLKDLLGFVAKDGPNKAPMQSAAQLQADGG